MVILDMPTANKPTDETVKELFDAGAHFAYSRTRRHPSARGFIYGAKNTIDIFDLTKTSEALSEATEFIKETAAKGGTVLFVGSKNEARAAVRSAAEHIDQPYVDNRWIGGTITNFSEIRSRVNRLEGLMDQREKGELTKYTKKEQLDFSREIEKLNEFFGGLRRLESAPAAIVVVDPRRENTAVREAKRKGIPIVAIAGSHADFGEIDQPIPANDSNRKSIKYIIDKLAAAYDEGAKEKPAKE